MSISRGGGVSPCADGQKVTVHKDKNPLHKHFAGMPMKKLMKICRRLKWMGGFHVVAKIIRELKSHMIPYKFKCSHWWKIALQSECCNFNQ